MVLLEEKRSLRPASCCSVEVVNGAAGRRVYGLVSTERTLNSALCRPAARAVASSSLRCTALREVSSPLSLKSRPLATLAPSTAASFALKDPESAPNWPVRSQYEAALKAIR